jgi:type VI secretion system secreted protein VgrG
MPIPTQAYRELEIITPLGVDVLLLRSFTFHEQLGQMFSLELEVLSTDISIDFEDLLGQNITARMDMNRHKGKIRFFNGQITQLSQVEHTRGFATYRLTVSPWLWFLTRTSDCRIFQNKTVPDIVTEVFNLHGYTDYKKRLTSNYRTWEYCVQYRETDFNFVSRLMEQEGIYYFFEHENGKHTLILCDAPSAHKPIPDYETIPFYPPDDTVVRDEDYINSWSINKGIQPGTYALEDYNFKKPMADLSAQSIKTEGHEADDFEIFDYPGEYTNSGEGNTYAKIRLEELHAGYEKKQGSSNTRGLFAGGLFNLKKFHRKDQNRQYLVTSVSHTAQQDLFTSGNNSDGNIYNNSFTVIKSDRKFRSPRTTPKPTIQGLQTATVVGKKGEEIDTDEYGRVKCQFRWDRYSKADENSSCWIRVAHSWAGNQWGTMYLPRIGQEVIVEFLEGDPDRPLITGQVYNKDNKPPYDLPAKKNISGIKTRSTKGGGGFNEITMDDTKGKEQIFIHAEKQYDQRTKKDHLTWVGKNQHHIVKGTYFDNVNGDRHQTIGGELNYFVKDTLSIDVKEDIHQKATKNYAHESGDNIHLKAGKNVVIEASTKLTLKVGGNFITIDSGAVTVKGSMVKINSGGSAGSGGGASPEKAKLPKEADNRKPPKKMKTKGKKHKKKSHSINPTVMVLRGAAKSGTPFCEICNK